MLKWDLAKIDVYNPRQKNVTTWTLFLLTADGPLLLENITAIERNCTVTDVSMQPTCSTQNNSNIFGYIMGSQMNCTISLPKNTAFCKIKLTAKASYRSSIISEQLFIQADVFLLPINLQDQVLDLVPRYMSKNNKFSAPRDKPQRTWKKRQYRKTLVFQDNRRKQM